LIVANLMLVPGLTNLVRWQSHWHVVRQGWTFFQNDFAGRIAARVMQTGPALRESVVLSIIGIWYILVFGVIAIGLLSAADWRLSLPIVAWFVLYVIVLGRFLPQMRERSREMSELRSVLTGKIVDSYTNILTVKLFARAREEDAFVRVAVDEHTETWRTQQRIGTLWGLSLQVMNALLMVGLDGPERGRILLDGRDVAGLTQESLRAQIGMVTQDTSLLHRSVRDNIRYGRPEASEAEIVDAARRANALEFIEGLEDWH